MTPKRTSVYNRKKDVNIYITDFGLTVVAVMEDRAHNMEVELDIELPTMVISDIRGRMPRIPREECREALPALQRAAGLEIKRGLSVKMEETIGGKIGCSHMTNLVMEACYCSFQGHYMKLREIAGDILDEMSDPERMKAFVSIMPRMLDSCIVYSEASSLIKEAKSSPETENFNRLISRIAGAYGGKAK
ncbi:MAG: DUF2889 domain-containing protein [Deltaproteobacteria bacterium]|uniref:DUF2889 domain-containing protein n=1 Tax=Candidatus Zymogenus saltonus TaxID=2844893 RepID=A0A9D8KEY3_9DELT|nr:DUF2889 domain-containing protein [Candidatus Zymogenus saltonus]